MGFAISGILVFTGNENLLNLNTNSTTLTIFLNGLLSAGGVWLIHTTQEMLERAFEK